MAVYRVIEAGVVINRIEWDGVSPYDPGAGRTVEAEAESGAQPAAD